MTGRRRDGFAPIEDYAVLGDGRTVALVAADGRIDWWPFPTLDSPPICAALLDPGRGGHFSLTPREVTGVARRYVEDTNVVETTWRTAGGTAVVTDALTTGTSGRLPWTELARRVEGLDGTVTFDWEFTPGDRFGAASPWITDADGRPVAHVGDQTMAVVTRGTPAVTGPRCVRGTVEVGRGGRALVAVVATDHEPLFLPSATAIDERIDATVDSWRRWSAQLSGDGPWSDAVRRSALALKTLLAEESGAIAAAATTSLPEGIGGEKNWDYRFSWVRDSSFTLDALISLGLDQEVHGAVSWLLGAIRRNGCDLHVFYTLGGDLADDEVTLDIRGYRDSRPVRAGNSAAGQLQLGTYGDLFDTVFRYCNEGHVLDPATGSLLADLADACCDRWRSRDSGIWELATPEHYTISKMGCWVALDRAVRLADAGALPGRNRDRWQGEAADIREWVGTRCWSERRGAYSFYAGTDDLDAAVLLAGRTGFDCGERLSSTIDAVTAELARGPLVYRYSGMEAEEGAFVACSFWLVDALVRVGRRQEAADLMDRAVGLVNDVGLLAEQIDPDSRAFLGNLPQGLSHLALINAAFALDGGASAKTRP